MNHFLLEAFLVEAVSSGMKLGSLNSGSERRNQNSSHNFISYSLMMLVKAPTLLPGSTAAKHYYCYLLQNYHLPNELAATMDLQSLPMK